ncbi:hypothetical protein V2G26_015394 [Clonostachys chloroleuca]
MSQPSDSDQTSQQTSDQKPQQQAGQSNQSQENAEQTAPPPDSNQPQQEQEPGQAPEQDPEQQAEELRKLREAFNAQTEQAVDLELAKVKEAVQKGDPHQVAMSLSVLLALTICPAMLGSQEAIRQSQSKSRREEHRARRCNLVVSCVKRSIRSRDINNKLVVLRDNKLYISNEFPNEYNDDSPPSDDGGYPFAGYFLPYPDSKYEGLVSTIMDEPPILNWIYVDRETYEVKYGVRVDAQPNLTGPFDCTKQDRRMIFDGWEGFCAVEETPGVWAVYFDCDDDGLKTKVPMGTRVLEIELLRREKKEKKPAEDEKPKNMEQKMAQHKAQTAAEESEKAAFLKAEQEAGAGQPNGTTTSQGDTPKPSEPVYSPGSSALPDPEKLKKLEETMRTLNIMNGAFSKVKTTPLANHDANNSTAPSESTHDPAGWSDSEKQGGADHESITAASSVYNEAAKNAKNDNANDDNDYKKPYVEEMKGPEVD